MGSREIEMLVLSKITAALRERDIFNTQCRKQHSSHRRWGNRGKKGLGEYGNVVPSPEFTGGLKTDRKAKQINLCVLKGAKHSYLYIIYKYMPAAY